MVNTFLAHPSKLMVAHLGSIKITEFDYVDPIYENNETERNKKCFYKQHLGLLGITKLLDMTKPELTIISEFGEELKEKRSDIVHIIGDVLGLNCLEGDIGVYIKLDDLSIRNLKNDLAEFKSKVGL
jgi:hypothetical protein